MVDLGNARTQISRVTFDYPNNQLATRVLEFFDFKNLIRASIDMSLFTLPVTVRVFEKVNGVNYRQLAVKIYPTDLKPVSVHCCECPEQLRF